MKWFDIAIANNIAFGCLALRSIFNFRLPLVVGIGIVIVSFCITVHELSKSLAKENSRLFCCLRKCY